MAKTGRKQCIKKGCRKLQFDGWKHCKEHKPFDPVEDVTKLEVAEAEKWGRLDAEIRNALLSQRCKALENKLDELSCRENLQKLARNYEAEQKRLADAFTQQKAHLETTLLEKRTARSLELEALKQQVDRQKIAYQAITKEMADKYKVDINKMVVDPDTRIIREAE
jgi:predicted DNA binding CopG/RHH family protein